MTTKKTKSNVKPPTPEGAAPDTKPSEGAKKPVVKRLAYLFVIVSLCAYWFFLMLPQITPGRYYDNNSNTLYTFSLRSQHVFTNTPAVEQFPIWQTRVASEVVAGWFINAGFDQIARHPGAGYIEWGGQHFNYVAIYFALYQTLWLFLTFLALMFFRKDALLIIVGTFAGLMYNLTLPAGSWFYPWDMPSLFFFTCAVLAYDSRRLAPLVAVVLLASAFKETGLCTALLILFGAHWEIRKRVALFVAIVVVSFAIRKALLWGYSVHTAFLPFNEATSTFDFITKAIENVRVNVIELFQFHLNSPFFANCGMLSLMFVFSWKTHRDRLFKLVTAVFVAGHFCFGLVHEFREWYELLPLGWMIFSERFEKNDSD